ncbi:hypothetical protein AB0I53_23590 [Saccharopolyspora sp. NPDC050389]|uniref:hypothetical protein n=1 Tax=Saccharopolyspora sp. NPDC050389 TaxID=3155516 RepID=UPI0034102C89
MTAVQESSSVARQCRRPFLVCAGAAVALGMTLVHGLLLAFGVVLAGIAAYRIDTAGVCQRLSRAS